MSFKEYLELDDFWRTAIILALNGFHKEQEDKQKEYLTKMENKLQEIAPRQSGFAGMPMPSFQQK